MADMHEFKFIQINFKPKNIYLVYFEHVKA